MPSSPEAEREALNLRKDGVVPALSRDP